VASRWYSVVVDCRDVQLVAGFWQQALGWQRVYEADDEVCLSPEEDDDDPRNWPGLTFVPVPEAKTVKNRLHLDLAPDDQAAEVERLLALGARRVDVGQQDVGWVVLADPEGNELCVLTPRGPDR
jgi:predicted enzyme related to lactoylglutathione lyase